MLTRKLGEIGSDIYRAIVFPFVRISIELKTKSIMKQRTYTNKGTVLRGRNYIGKGSVLTNVDFGFGSYISANGDLANARVGKYCSIGPNLTSVGGNHPVHDFVSIHPAFYARNNGAGFDYMDCIEGSRTTDSRKTSGAENQNNAGSTLASGNLFDENKYVDQAKGYFYEIGNDVWIGANVSICQGVYIADGAVVGTGTLVNKDLEPYGIYAGVPAKKIGSRFTDEEIEKLLNLKWWDKGEEWIKLHANEFNDIRKLEF